MDPIAHGQHVTLKALLDLPDQVTSVRNVININDLYNKEAIYFICKHLAGAEISVQPSRVGVYRGVGGGESEKGYQEVGGDDPHGDGTCVPTIFGHWIVPVIRM